MSLGRQTATGSDRHTTSAETVFVVSDDPAIRDSIAELAASAGLQSETFVSLQAWLNAAAPKRGGCLVLDAAAVDTACLARLTELSVAGQPVLLLVDRGDVPIAVRAIKLGAMDVLEKPYRNVTLLESIKRLAARASNG
jgi:two-component system response regulator FixJ